MRAKGTGMVNGIGADHGASAMLNAYIRELGGAGRGRGRLRTNHVESTQAANPVPGKSELTEEERQEVETLKERDQEVRGHEAAHKAAAGQFAKGGPQFEYTRGPDGRQYASGGEVSIDTSPVDGDPQATIRKMQQVRRAASAPANPSAQDRKVAAQAAQAEAKARAELAKEGAGLASGLRGDQIGESSRADAIGQNNVFVSPRGQARPRGVFIDVRA